MRKLLISFIGFCFFSLSAPYFVKASCFNSERGIECNFPSEAIVEAKKINVGFTFYVGKSLYQVSRGEDGQWYIHCLQNCHTRPRANNLLWTINY